MDGALLAVAALACPVGMGLMMWMMMRNNGGTSGQSTAPQADQGDQQVSLADHEVAELRSEIEQLKAERVEKRSTAGEL